MKTTLKEIEEGSRAFSYMNWKQVKKIFDEA